MSEDERITRRFSLKTLSDANTPKYTEKNKKTTQDYVSTIEGEKLSSFVSGKVQNWDHQVKTESFRLQCEVRKIYACLNTILRCVTCTRGTMKGITRCCIEATLTTTRLQLEDKKRCSLFMWTLEESCFNSFEMMFLPEAEESLAKLVFIAWLCNSVPRVLFYLVNNVICACHE